MAQLYVGTSGWAYPSWKPDFYPEKLAQKKFLTFYATKLNAVEVNYTFRQLVKDTTVQNWIAETPDHFLFTIKAHQVLTHIKRLKATDEFLKRFLGTLEALANNSLLIVNAGAEDELVDDNTLNTYDPQLFRYTTLTGTQIEIDRTGGVKKVTDLNGNILTFGPNGITHSSGKGVTFTRDAQGRITQITDPQGAVHQYAYDANGDLVSHIDAVGNTAHYTHNRTHGLLDIIDTAGNRAVRNEYDDEGRLIATIDGQGNRIEFTHDIGAQQETIRGRLGTTTVLAYDAVGNVVSRTDALGNRTEFTYDSQGNQLTQKDALGRISTQTYDAANNLLSKTDFDGNTTSFTYNTRGQMLTLTDPTGKTLTNVYDANGHVVQTTGFDGGVRGNTYDAGGNLASTTAALGQATQFTYDTFGNLTSVTDALGNTSVFTYDTNGQQLSQATTRSLPGGGTETLTTQFTYDAGGRLVKTTDALGFETLRTYSGIGDGQKLDSVVDASGRTVRYEYDILGNRVQTIFPDGTVEARTYDVAGRVLTRTDRDGRTFAYEYDVLGRTTKITNPDGSATAKTYDAVGRLLTETDERGNTTTHSYGPNTQSETDALGNVTSHEFDGNGRHIRMTDALGHVTTFTYDGKGRLLTTTFPDGSSATRTYDAAGQKIAETDQAGRTTQFAYDAAGRLVRVTDALGGVTTYTYDEVGNGIAQTDANGQTTRLDYDALGRMTALTLPLGQKETRLYDSIGNVTSYTDFNGQTSTFVYDAAGRVSEQALPGGTVVPYAFTGTGLRTQAGGDTYAYDSRGRLSKETKASGETLAYSYDAAGNRTSVTTPQGTTSYSYDALDRLATVVDASGTTAYTYDAVGNLASTTYPNGVATAYSYDTLNRLLQMSNTGPGGLLSSYTYTLGPTGNRLQVVEAGAATTGRTVSYAYDALYRLTQENVDEPGTASEHSISYTYDAVGNRNQIVRDGVTTSYTYDGNNRLLTETTGASSIGYAYDANGNTLSRTQGSATDTYTYDAQNRLVAANVQTNGPPRAVSYGYDADGLRTSKTIAGVTTSFLVDKNRDFGQVVVENTGGAVTTYTHGQEIISQTRAGAGTHFYQYDGQRSTRQLTAAAGAVSDSYTYDAFGVSLNATGATPNVYLYTGEQFDPDVGLYYLRARYLDPRTGRFWSQDSLGGDLSDPPSLHRYLYAHANPINRIDPSGNADFNLQSVMNVLSIISNLFVLYRPLAVGFSALRYCWPDAVAYALFAGAGGKLASFEGGALGGLEVFLSPKKGQGVIKWFLSGVVNGELEGAQIEPPRGSPNAQASRTFGEGGGFEAWLWGVHKLDEVGLSGAFGIGIGGTFGALETNGKETGLIFGVAENFEGTTPPFAFGKGKAGGGLSESGPVSEAEMAGIVGTMELIFTIVPGLALGVNFAQAAKINVGGNLRGSGLLTLLAVVIDEGLVLSWIHQTYGTEANTTE